MSTAGNELILEARRVKYYSHNDEAAFFGWLDKITCVTSYRGRIDTLYISVDRNALDNEGFSELFGLFRRYNIDRTQLEPLAPETFRSWFTDH